MVNKYWQIMKCFQCLGYRIAVNAIPKSIVKYVSDCLGIQLDKVKLQNYMQLKQRPRHKLLILK